MSESWGAPRPDAGMWWNTAAQEQQQQTMQHHQQMLQQQIHQQQQQQEVVPSTAASQQQNQQLFSYKMASSFENPATNISNVSSTSPIGAAGIREYDYRLAGGNPPPMTMPTAATQWWYPPSTMDNMHSSMQQNPQQNMPPVQSPPPTQIDQARLDEVNRQQHEAIQRHHQQQQEAHHQALQQHQALVEAQHRHQQQLNNHHHNQVLQQQQLVHTQHTQPVVAAKGKMPRGKNDNRPRGRMTAYAFFVQTCREEHKKKHPEENVVFAEFSRKCAERWKTMSDKEKKRFHEMAEKDKVRYDAEMQNYTPPKGEKQRGKKRKQIKDPNAPKRSLSAFFWFSNDERGKVKAENPEYGVGDIAKELGRRWAEAGPELKGKFEVMADRDKARYEKEMTAYKKRNMQPPPVESVPDEDEGDEENDDDEDE